MEEEQVDTKPKGPTLANHQIQVVSSLMPVDAEEHAINVRTPPPRRPNPPFLPGSLFVALLLAWASGREAHAHCAL